jgi:ATP-binding cassette, subfamily B, bacterial PglK
VVGTVLGASFGLIQLLVKRRLHKIGVERRQANRRRFNVVQEAFGGIKDVKVSGLEETFVRRFQGPARILAKQGDLGRTHRADAEVRLADAAVRRHVAGPAVPDAHPGGFQDAAPVAALFGFGAYRLFPAIQMLVFGDRPDPVLGGCIGLPVRGF